MKIYGLSGKSGTGKSYNAGELCGRMHIPAIIDDGLFICGSTIVAGTSAKKQETRIGAVKTALFMDNSHCAEVRAAIRRTKPDSILILGTSDDMVEKIAERLGLPKPSRIIHIEDITTPAQRNKASKERSDVCAAVDVTTFECGGVERERRRDAVRGGERHPATDRERRGPSVRGGVDGGERRPAARCPPFRAEVLRAELRHLRRSGGSAEE